MFSYLWSALMIIVRSFSFCFPSVTPSLVFVTSEGVTKGQQKEQKRTMIIKAFHR
jgi:hypothetical protein